MSVNQKALRVFTLPFRAVWFLILAANFLLLSAACMLVAALVGYAVALTFSFAFLSPESTQALWHWAADLYDRSSWFKAATIASFALLVLPILRFWPARDPIADAAHERKMTRLNDDLVAARQRGRR